MRELDPRPRAILTAALTSSELDQLRILLQHMAVEQ
jgi:hypothetical protein